MLLFKRASLVKPISSVRHILLGVVILAIGLAARWPHMSQSLWYDEMTTLVDFVLQPWGKILAPSAGEYVPNNHVLHTILVKLVYAHPELVPPREWVLRLPALVAGLLVPIALAWPMRKSAPGFAFAIALLATLHPWLVDFSCAARGYSLVLLLGIIATNLLPLTGPVASATDPLAAEAASPVIHLGFYAGTLALAIYTIPLAVLFIPAHFVAMLVLRGSRIKAWLLSVAGALFVSGALYLPMYRGLISYYRNPFQTTITYRQFLDQLPRFALTGVAIPHGPAIFWAMPVIAIVLGSVLGWSRVALRPMLLTLGSITLMGILIPLISPAATEVRFDPWILPWFCIAILSVLFAAPVRWGKIAGVLGFLVLIGWQIAEDVTLLPQQPIREGLQQAIQLVPKDRDIMVLYLGARESIALYGDDSPRLLAAPDATSMRKMQQRSLDETGHLPWVIIFYEKLAMQRNFDSGDARGLWTNLVTLYDERARLPGRLTPVAIYSPK